MKLCRSERCPLHKSLSWYGWETPYLCRLRGVNVVTGAPIRVSLFRTREWSVDHTRWARDWHVPVNDPLSDAVLVRRIGHRHSLL